MYSLYQPYKKPAPKQGAKLPIRPIRWRAFWRGSVYANPVNDLFGVLLDLSARASIADQVKGLTLKIHFTKEAILVERINADPTSYRFQDIKNLHFNYAPFGGDFHHGNRSNNITFLTVDGTMTYHFMHDQAKLKNICMMLLEQRIPFKEFFGGVRAHLGRQDYSYQEIQDLKKEYGIVW